LNYCLPSLVGEGIDPTAAEWPATAWSIVRVEMSSAEGIVGLSPCAPLSVSMTSDSKELGMGREGFGEG